MMNNFESFAMNNSTRTYQFRFACSLITMVLGSLGIPVSIVTVADLERLVDSTWIFFLLLLTQLNMHRTIKHKQTMTL